MLWQTRTHTFDLSRRALVMGILNVTSDSFSDGGAYLEIDSAVDHAREMIAAGADIIDIGGESTRPGAEPVTEDFEKNWDAEWKKQLLEVALRRVRGKVKLRHYMIFEMAVLREASIAEIKKTLGVGLAMIYVTKHRVQKLVAAELRRMEESP